MNGRERADYEARLRSMTDAQLVAEHEEARGARGGRHFHMMLARVEAAARGIGVTEGGMMQRAKWTPVQTLIRCSDGLQRVLPVLQTRAFPPGHHPEGCPLTADCTAVQLSTAEGSRWWGFERAEIDSFLRMRVTGYSPQNEIVQGWEDARDEHDEPQTTTVFRRWPNGDIIALFPEIPADDRGMLCQSYLHVGQHGGADYQVVIRQTRPATHEEAAPLRAELAQIGYRLKERVRITREMDRKRREEARAE